MDWQHSSVFAASRGHCKRTSFRCWLFSGLDLEWFVPRRLWYDDDQHSDPILADHARPRRLRRYWLGLSLHS